MSSLKTPPPPPPKMTGTGAAAGTSITTPSVSMGTGVPTTPAGSVIVPPTMGGVLEVETGIYNAWTGGKPNVDWTSLDVASATLPVTPHMFRPSGARDGKAYSYRKKGMETKFGMKDDLKTFCRHVMKHLVENGMDTISYLPDPSDPTKMESIVEVPNKFTKTYVATQVDNYEALFDSYDNLNGRTAIAFVLSSLSPELERKVTEALVSTTNPSFYLVWMTLIEKIRVISVARFDILEKKVKSRKPTDYPGQNLDTMAEANIRDLVDLQQGGWYSASTGVTMVENFASANSECFEYKSFAYEILKNYRKAVTECFHMSPGDSKTHMSSKDFDFESVCQMFSEYYIAANQDGKWLPTRNIRDTKAPPSNFAHLAITEDGKKGPRAYSLIQNSSSGSSQRKPSSALGTCHNCGKEGHWARNCPTKAKNSGITSQKANATGTSGKAVSASWTRTPPAANAPQQKSMHGKTFHWCGKCKRWTTSHGTDQHVGKQEGESVPKQANLSMIRDFAAWHFTVEKDDDDNEPPFIVRCATTLWGFIKDNVVYPFFLAVAAILSFFCIIIGYVQFLMALQVLGFYGCIAPFSWMIMFILFLVLKPLAKVVDEPIEKPPNRRVRRYYNKVYRQQNKKRSTKPTTGTTKRNFHRSYPLRLRSKDVYKYRSSSEFEGIRSENDIKFKWKAFVQRENEKYRKRVRERKERELRERTSTAPSTLINRKGKSPGDKLFKCMDGLGEFIRSNEEEQRQIDLQFQDLTFVQKRAVASIKNDVLMYRPDLSSKLKRFSAFIATVSEDSSKDSPLVQKLTQYAPAWFGSTGNKKLKYSSIIWDSGASISISHQRNDFVGEIREPEEKLKLTGVSTSVKVAGVGHVAWPMQDVHGMLRTLKLPALLVPGAGQRLLSTSSLLQAYPDETISLSETKATLSGCVSDRRGSIEAMVDPSTNLPTTEMYDLNTTTHSANLAQSIVSTVAAANHNLTEPEKELLKWHQRLCHLDFKKIKFLFRTGILSRGETNRHLHTSASKLLHNPKCAACQFGKQFQRSVPTTTGAKVSDKVGAIGSKAVLPGEQISIDHFVCKTKGRLFTSRGKTDPNEMYCGGCVFVDHYSGLIHVEFQQNLNTHETLLAKDKFEAMARDHGVIPQSYLSDNGPAFASHEFGKRLEKFEQVSKFAGAGAHHQNGIAERSIRTVISIARTMMLHAAVHWPEVSDPSLWPMAVQHAAFVFNRMPQIESGLCPLDMFNRQRWKQSQLHGLHVWGCPVYVLDKKIADGIKIPKWAARSNRSIYMGTSNKHALSVPLLLNPESGVISPQFHVVFDDWFATIGAKEDDLPDFNSEQWHKMFGDTAYQYMIDDEEEPPEETYASVVQARHDRVEEAMSREQPPIPLPVPDPPTTSPGTPPSQAWNRSSTKSPFAQAQLDFNDGYTTGTLLDTPFKSPHPREQPPIASPMKSPTKTPTHVTIKEPSFASVNDTGSPPVVSTVTAIAPSESKLPSPAEPVERRVTRSMTRSEAEVGRPKRTIVPPKRFNYWSYPMCYNVQHPSFEHSNKQTGAMLSYLANTLLCTTPPTSSASELISASAFKASVGDPDTLSYDEAMSDKENVDEWRATAQKEILTLEAHGTWEEDLIENAKTKILPGTWVFRVKRSPDGTITKRKGRYCVRGDLQEGDRDTFAPVVAWSTVRLVMIVSWLLNWETSAIDFSSAFVQAILKIPVWIHLPRGFQSSDGKKKCLRLKKSLYGLSEAPRLWYLHLFNALINKLKFTQSKFDPCLLYKKDMMIIVFVDDCGIFYKDKKDYTSLIKELQAMGFELTEEGSFTKFLGIQFDRVGNTTKMTQTGLITRIAEATGLTNSNPNWTPTSHDALGADPNGPAMKDDWNYRSVIGMLLYLSTNTRPDIAFAVSQAARFSNNPKQSHATAVKTIVRYLYGTKDKGTVVKPTGKLDLQLYVDADFAGLYKREPDTDANAARSRTGYILILGGFPLIWKSHLQTEISLSTLEAEYSALSSSIRALIPIRELLFETIDVLSVPNELKTSIVCNVFEDNQGAYLLGTTHRITNRTKYFLVKFHHFWYYIDLENGNNRKIHLHKVATTNQGADFLTKGLSRTLFENNRMIILGW